MSKTNIFLGKTSSDKLLRSADQQKILQQGKLLSIELEGEKPVYLDGSQAVATAWLAILDYLNTANRPVYIESETDTQVITELAVPEAALVWHISDNDNDSDRLAVAFHTASAQHYLRRNHPQFDLFLQRLQQAKTSGNRVLVTASMLDFDILDVREMPAIFHKSFDSNESETPLFSNELPDLAPVSMQRAIELFAILQTESCVPCHASGTCVPFKYPSNGCWIRAHLMSFALRENGAEPGKIWIDGKLQTHSMNVPNCLVSWAWHVASVLLVIQPDGQKLPMVLDPSMSSEPILPETWKAMMRDHDSRLRYSDWTQYGHYGGEASKEVAESDMKPFQLYLNQMCAQYGPSPYSQCLM